MLSLQAFPAPGWTFIQWNPLIDGGYGPPPPSRPCANSQALVCATTLTTNIIVEAVFYRPAVTTCVLLPLGPAVRNSSLGVRVRCTTPVSITLAGVLSERQPSGRRATFALRTIHRLHVGRGWTLHPRLPLDAVAALKTGATGSVRFTLTYQNASVGTGLATARVGPLTVSSTGS